MRYLISIVCLSLSLVASAQVDTSNEATANAVESNAAMRWASHTVVGNAKGSINSAVATDFDGDGVMDVLSSFDGQVVLLKGPQWNRFPVHSFDPANSSHKPRPACIHSCLMDVDGDGDQDFCGSNNTVFWLECPEDPFSGEPWAYHVVDDEILGTHCLITGDVNQDGRLDLIANSGRAESETKFHDSLAWLEVPKNPATASQWVRHIFADKDAPGGSHYTGIADMNGDGRPDISCGAKGGEGFPRGEWFAWWQQPAEPTGVWEKHMLAENQPGATNIHPVDLNGDGQIDFAATRGHSQGVLWFRGPTFELVEIDAEIAGPHCLATVDLDKDGDIDLATCGRASDGLAAWYENDGQASFTRHVIGINQGSYDIRTVDMDGDQDLDVLIAGHVSKNIVWYENPVR